MIGLKYNMSLPMAAGALLVGIPYSISLVAQWMYGWPNKPGYKKYIEALKPRRIYCLTRAVLEMLKYFQYGKLYFQWKSWYKNVENHKHYEKGITFGRRSNKLDLYYSPTVGQPGSGPVPVVVFIYGGAWGSGERSIYCLLAMQMAKELSATVICPDYCTYPKGNVLCMVQDIADCLIWARDSGHKFNFDKVSLHIYHSSVNLLHSNYFATIGQFMNFVCASTTNSSFVQFYRVPPFCLLHGTNDIIVPVESSQRFSELLTALSIKVSLYLMPKMDHTEIVTDLMATDRHFYKTVYSCIKQEYSKFIGQVCDC
nr:probable isoprenylcysteine alpha-carbonyl methylesterase ICMEL1 [Oncorhynchus nerka]